MTQRTLKEVAQAGLVLGFEWADIENGRCYLSEKRPSVRYAYSAWLCTGIIDLPPEKSLLRLRDIVDKGFGCDHNWNKSTTHHPNLGFVISRYCNLCGKVEQV